MPIPFPPSYDSVTLAKLFAERNVAGKELFEIYLAPGEPKEDVAFRQVLQKVVGTVSDVKVYYGSVKGETKEHTQLEAGLSAAYIRAVAKVAFHYHLWTSTTDTGAEFHYRSIRQFIRHGHGDSSDFVDFSGPQFVAELKDGNVPAQFSHFFGVTKVGAQVFGLVQFFVGPEHMTPPALVHLAQTKRYFPNQGHWVAYYGEKVKGYDGEIKELDIRR